MSGKAGEQRLREVVKRLCAAANTTAVHVTVLREDLEVFILASKVMHQPRPVDVVQAPDFHPEQR